MPIPEPRHKAASDAVAHRLKTTRKPIGADKAAKDHRDQIIEDTFPASDPAPASPGSD